VSVTYDEVSFRGKAIRVPSSIVDGRVVVVTGRWLKVAALKDEEWIEADEIPDPFAFVRDLQSSGLAADVFVFSKSSAGSIPRAEQVTVETDNVAVIDTSNFKAWWDGLPQEARKNTRRAAKRGVVIENVPFDEKLVEGIKAIYDEAPVRQGRRFWHYGKSIDTVRRENGTYLDRSTFLGAFFAGQLVGLIKLVRVGDAARIMQIVSLAAHRDKRPIVALIAEAAKTCAQQGCRCLIYGKFTYGKYGDSSLAEFKRRMGFRQVDFPRVYVPITPRGKIALRLGLHRGLQAFLPSWLVARLIRLRGRLLEWRSPAPVDTEGRAGGEV
jgi:hypothetical protein